MTEATVVGIAQQAMVMMIVVAGPLLLVSLVVGLLVSIFQAVTQINEMTLTFVPKIIGIFAVLLVLGPWMLQSLLSYTANTFIGIASDVR
jgi:flagellar biosynthetic protein FliQ